jgi:probable F420-dependent oxidoreductase
MSWTPDPGPLQHRTMNDELGAYGVWRMVSGVTPELARQVELLGFGAIWVGGSPQGDLEAIASLLDATERIPVATGIVNMWREDAGTVARSFDRLTKRHPGRFRLGVGIGHREATEEWSRPFEKIKDYLDRLDAAGVPKKDRMLAALGPRALSVAAERTAGAHPYLTSPRHTRFARGVLGEGPVLAPEQKVVVDTDPVRARSIGRAIVGRYLNRVNYRNNLIREGWDEDDLSNGGSDRLIDALVLHGTAEEISAGLEAHHDAGADHVAIQVLGDDPLQGCRVLAGILFG